MQLIVQLQLNCIPPPNNKRKKAKYAARPVRRQKSLVSPGRNPIEVRRLTKKDM